MTLRKIKLHPSTAATMQWCWWMMVFTLVCTIAGCFGIACFAVMWGRLTPIHLFGPRLQYTIALTEFIACFWLGVRCFKFLEPRLMRLLRARQPWVNHASMV